MGNRARDRTVLNMIGWMYQEILWIVVYVIVRSIISWMYQDALLVVVEMECTSVYVIVRHMWLHHRSESNEVHVCNACDVSFAKMKNVL